MQALEISLMIANITVVAAATMVITRAVVNAKNEVKESIRELDVKVKAVNHIPEQLEELGKELKKTISTEFMAAAFRGIRIKP